MTLFRINMNKKKSWHLALRLGVAMLLAVFATAAQVRAGLAQNARVDSINVDMKHLTLTVCNSECSGKQVTLTVPEEQAHLLKGLQTNDRVTVASDEKSGLQSLVLTGRQVDKEHRFLVFSCALIACILMGTLLTWWHPLKLVIGEDGRYSNSKFQMAMWFCLVLASYLSMVVLRVSRVGWDLLGGINIPNNLLLLSGMSSLTFAGAKGITTAKIDAALAGGQQNPKPSGVPNFWKDLLQNDSGAFDFGDFQMFVVTLLAIGMYAVTFLHALQIIAISRTTALPDIDTTILAAFGLGQGAYLTKKAVGKAGTS